MAAAASAAHVDREVEELVGAAARASLDDGCRNGATARASLDDGCRKCSRAFEEKEKLLTCVCRKVRYCNEACQKADWKNHRPSCPKFVVKESPGKGKGVFATRKLPFGTVIMEEAPLMAVVDHMVDSNLSLFGTQYLTRSKVIQEFEKLSDEKQKKFLNLYHTGAEINSTNLILRQFILSKKVVSIFKCNAFAMEEGKSVVFETSSRINHSCAPNACRDYKSNELRASRQIEKDEEIFVTYLGIPFIYASRDKRKNILLSNWEFECSCMVCSLEGDELRKNENLRKQIEDAYEEFQCKKEEFKQGRIEPRQLLRLAKRKLNLLRQLKSEMIQIMDHVVLDCYEFAIITNPKNPENEEYRKEARYLTKIGGDTDYKALIKCLKDNGFPIPEID